MINAISLCVWLFIFVSWCIKGGLLLLFAGEKHSQEHHYAAVVLLSVIPVPILCAYEEFGEQASGTVVRIATPTRVCGRSGFWGASPQLLAFFLGSFFLVTVDIFFFFFLGSSNSWWMFEGLHCEHRLASTVVHDIEQHTMSTSVRGATGAFEHGSLHWV
jgi:hypothetical protein